MVSFYSTTMLLVPSFYYIAYRLAPPIFFAQESKYYLFLKQKNFPAYLLEDISSFLDNKSIKEYGLNSNSFCSCIDYIVSIQDVWKNLSVLF